MKKIRVLIVDDAVVVRRMVSDVVAEDAALEVAGTAANGRIALVKIGQVNPDVVTLDLEMPELDGLETLRAIRAAHPLLPVIMLSRFTKRGAAATLDALQLGAADCVALPDGPGKPASLEALRQQLLPKLKALGVRTTPPEKTPAAVPAPPRRPSSESGASSRQRIDVVAIGTSTGGPNALTLLMPQFPANCPAPLVIVQHMPPVFTRYLAERLTGHSKLTVREGVAGAVLEPGQAWFAPGDYHMAVARDAATVQLRLHQGAPENSCRPAVDVLFRSVAETYGPGVLAVVLTGMGQDGLRGCESIRAAGGQVLVQDEASSVVWGMPGIVARAGLANQVLPLDELGPEIVRRVFNGRSLSFAGKPVA